MLCWKKFNTMGSDKLWTVHRLNGHSRNGYYKLIDVQCWNVCQPFSWRDFQPLLHRESLCCKGKANLNHVSIIAKPSLETHWEFPRGNPPFCSGEKIYKFRIFCLKFPIVVKIHSQKSKKASIVIVLLSRVLFVS